MNYFALQQFLKVVGSHAVLKTGIGKFVAFVC